MNDPGRSLVNSQRYRNNRSMPACAGLASASAEIAMDRRAARAAEVMRKRIMASSVLGASRSVLSAAQPPIPSAVDCGENSLWRVGAGTTIPGMLEPFLAGHCSAGLQTTPDSRMLKRRF
jgi:hypothetical protein